MHHEQLSLPQLLFLNCHSSGEKLRVGEYMYLLRN